MISVDETTRRIVSWQIPCPEYDPLRRELYRHGQQSLAMKLGLEPTEDLQVITIEAERLIHMLQQTTWRGNQNIHSRKPLPLILQILSTDHESCGKCVKGSN